MRCVSPAVLSETIEAVSEKQKGGRGATSMSSPQSMTALSGEHVNLEVQIQSQFQLLWAVFQSHSTAEDEVIWPALKEKARSSGGKVGALRIRIKVYSYPVERRFLVCGSLEGVSVWNRGEVLLQ